MRQRANGAKQVATKRKEAHLSFDGMTFVDQETRLLLVINGIAV